MDVTHRMPSWIGMLMACAAVLLLAAGCRKPVGAESAKPEPVPALKVPAGCKAKPGTVAEPYTHTGWAKEIVHEKTGIELVYIPAGTFMMGSSLTETGRYHNENQHKVTVSKGFYIGKYEVTQRQWMEIMGANPAKFKGDNLPIEQVSWDDSQKFCKKAGFSLPTEAEWEYACRAGTTGVYGGAGTLDEMGWYGDNSQNAVHPVGLKRANAWGIYDMHGNVWEWCFDWYGLYPEVDTTDPIVSARGSFPFRINRGGSWRNEARNCRSADRCWLRPDMGYYTIGFRVVLPAGR